MKLIVVLVSEPVRGRSRATELPCFLVQWIYLLARLDICYVYI